LLENKSFPASSNYKKHTCSPDHPLQNEKYFQWESKKAEGRAKAPYGACEQDGCVHKNTTV